MSLPSEPAVEESAEASVASTILAMSYEELYDMDDRLRSDLLGELSDLGNDTDNHAARDLLRLKSQVDRFIQTLSVLPDFPSYGNPYEHDSGVVDRFDQYEGYVVEMAKRLLSMISDQKKKFSERHIFAFENNFRQSLEQRCIYEGGGIDSASQTLLTSFIWSDNPKFSGITDEICRGMVQVSFMEQHQSDWPALFFSHYCLGKIDFNTFQKRLSVHVTKKTVNLHRMRDNMKRATLGVCCIFESGKPYEEDANEDDSPYDGTPYEIILQEHNQLLHYKAILALDEATLNTQLEPLIYLYRGEIKQ